MQSDGAVRAVRLLFIIVYLLHGPRRTDFLARRLGVTPRMIEYDMRVLGQEMHAPVYYDQGCWCLHEDWEMGDLLSSANAAEQTK